MAEEKKHDPPFLSHAQALKLIAAVSKEYSAPWAIAHGALNPKMYREMAQRSAKEYADLKSKGIIK